MVKWSNIYLKISINTRIMGKYKIQDKICNVRCYLLEESIDLLFPHSAQLYMVAESSITT